MLKTIFCTYKYTSQVCFQPICCLKNNVVDKEGIRIDLQQEFFDVRSESPDK